MLDTDFRLHQSTGFRLTRLTKLISLRLDRKLSELGLTRMKWCVLASVGLEGVHTSSDLADYIGITRQAASRVLVKMRKENLIVQTLGEEDARSRHIELTPLGQQMLEKCLPIVKENQERFLGKTSKENEQKLRLILDELLEGEAARIEGF